VRPVSRRMLQRSAPASARASRVSPPPRASCCQSAVTAGITVFSINSGYNTVEDIQFSKRPLLHIGQDEEKAGRDVAQALYDLGHRTAACVNDEASNLGKVARCTEFNAKFLELGTVQPADTTNCALTATADFGVTPGSCADVDSSVATCSYVAGSYSDSNSDGTPDTEDSPDSCTATLASSITTVLTSSDAELHAVNEAYRTSTGREAAIQALLGVAGLDVVVTLAADVAITVNDVIQAEGSSVGLATFDVHAPNDEINTMLSNGQLILAVDQQPFLQGFLPIMFMTTFKTSLMKAENTKLKTGPSLLTDAAAVAPYANYDLADIVMKAETHGQGGDGFWDVVYLGALQAAADMGVTLDMTDMCSPEFSIVGNGDLADEAMRDYIMAALASATPPAGFLVSIPDATTLRPPLEAAQAAGVAVVSLNSGYESAGSLGALTHVGMTEYEAGKMAGDYFVNRGHVSGLCLNHEPANNAIIQRCAGFEQAFTDAGLAYVNVDGSTSSTASDNQAHLVTQLNANPSVDCVLIGGQSAKGYVVGAIEAVGRQDTIKAGTFDYSTDVGDLVTQGKLEFGIHQQQYYQGYVPVVLLTLAQHRNLKLDESILFTGPAFITAADVAPRQCELTPTCSAVEVSNGDTVLRATFGADMEALRFATANFGMSAADMLHIWDRSPVAATVASDGCQPLSTATSPGSAIIMDEGNCLFTTKARHAQAAGYGMVIIARTTADTPVTMDGVDTESCHATDMSVSADVTTCAAVDVSGADATADQVACEAAGACTYSAITVPVVMVSQTDGARMKADTAATYRITPFVITCPVGSREVDFDCVLCPEGSYQDQLGQTTCKLCPAGTFSKTIGADTLSQCLPCPTGSYQDETGKQACKICADTAFSATSGSVSCETCPANNATGVMVVVSRTCGISLDTTAGTATDECDTNVPKTDDDSCYCTEGYFGAPGDTCGQCPEGGACCSCMELYDQTKLTDGDGTDIFDLDTIYANFETYDRPCSSCLYGATAVDTPPMPLPGFFTADPEVKANTFLPCVPEESCKGGPLSECAAGYAGFRCGVCAENYFRDSGACTECPTTPEWLVVLALSLIVVFCLYALNAVSRWFRSGALAIALDWSQTIVIVSGFALNWPRELSVFANLLSAFMFNTEFFAPECSVTTGYWSQWGTQLMLPFMVTFSFLAIYSIVRFRHQMSEKGWSDNHATAVANAFVNAYFMFLSVFHPFLTKNSLEIFRCREFADGKYYMDVQTSFECFDDEWYAHMPFAVLAFVIYGLGIPTLFWYVLRQGKLSNRLDERMFKRRYGSIFIVYKKEAWYWEIWIKSKKMLICIAMNLFPEETTYQAILAIVVMETAIHLNMKNQPFRFKPNNKVQKIASLNALAYLFSGLMFYSDKLDEQGEAYLINLMIVWVSCTGAWLVRSFLVEFVSYYGHWLIGKRPAWEGFLRSGCGEALLKSKSALGASHWASTEELLDRYSKSLRTSQKHTATDPADDGKAAPPADASASASGAADSQSGGKMAEQRRRALDTIGDVRQTNEPDPSLLLDLFFRDDALTVLAQWRETTDSTEDFAKLLSILTAVKGAGELIHMKMEMDKLDRIEAQTAHANAREENA
jgi:simple sugar transport system substrate-binding protein